MEQKEVVTALRDERERLVAYVRDLPDASWEAASLCEGWSVRDVVSHLIGNCADVLNQKLDRVGAPENNQRQVDERAGLTPAELLAEWDEKGPGVEAVYEALPPELWAMEMPGVIGSVGGGVLRHLEDLWIHAQDIRIPLGAGVSGGPGLRGALFLIAEELPRLLKAHAPVVGALELKLGEFHETISGPGDTVAAVAGDPVAFALVASGRRSLDDALVAGELVIDPPLENAARVLHIYGPEFSERV